MGEATTTSAGEVTATVTVKRTTVYERDEVAGAACWVAKDPERPGCYGFGTTQDDADARLERARAAYDAGRRAAPGETPPA